MMFSRLLVMLTMTMLATAAYAAEHGPAHADPHAPQAQREGEAPAEPNQDNHPHPAVSPDASWARNMVFGIVGLFVAALVVGLMVRANMPEPPAPSHEETDDAHGHDAHGHTPAHGAHH